MEKMMMHQPYSSSSVREDENAVATLSSYVVSSRTESSQMAAPTMSNAMHATDT